MQNSESLSYEAIPSRFCESGDYAEISTSASDAFSYANGLSSAFTMPGMYVGREHVNAIGRLGTSAQAFMQAGGTWGITSSVTYGNMAAVIEYDGTYIRMWVSTDDGNAETPVGADGSDYYKILDSAEASNWQPASFTKWASACADATYGFFDVN